MFSAEKEPIARASSGDTIVTRTWDSGGRDQEGVWHIRHPYVYPDHGNQQTSRSHTDVYWLGDGKPKRGSLFNGSQFEFQFWSVKMKQFFMITIGLLLIAGLVLAAGIDGTWNVVVQIPNDEIESTWIFKTKGETLFIVNDGEEQQVGTWNDGEFQYKIPRFYSEQAGYAANLTVKGRIEGDKLTAEWEFDSYTGRITGTRAK